MYDFQNTRMPDYSETNGQSLFTCPKDKIGKTKSQLALTLDYNFIIPSYFDFNTYLMLLQINL